MNLFLNAVSKKARLILFDDNRHIVASLELDVAWNESEKLIWLLNEFLADNNINYNNLENLVVVAWPGSFTWVRTIVLMINTINFVIDKFITKLSFFDLFDNYPIIKTSSKRDCFLQKSRDSGIEIISNDDLKYYLEQNNILKIYWDFDISKLEAVEIFDKIDYSSIIKEIKFSDSKIIEPLYIKKPNIS